MGIAYRQMKKDDIERIIPLYMEYWNGLGGTFTCELTYKRVWQVLGSPDAFCLLAEEDGVPIGFAMGRFQTYDDLTSYDLAEIIISSSHQNSGIGTSMMAELENIVSSMGASMVQLIAVNDELHEHFYGKLGYRDATNLKLKTKILNNIR